MKPGSGHWLAKMVGLTLLISGNWAATAFGDGGTLRAWRQHGKYEIAIFTEPSPLVAGPVDFSVLVLDRDTGAPTREASVAVAVSPQGQSAQTIRQEATEQVATNKLFRAAVFELHDAGEFLVNVSIALPNDHAEVQFELNVGTPWTPGTGIWPWILWPLPTIVLYGIHLRLVRRSPSRGANLQRFDQPLAT